MLLISKYIPPCYKIKPGKFIKFRVTDEWEYKRRKVHSIIHDTDKITNCKYGCLVVLKVVRGTKFWVSPKDIVDSGCLKCALKIKPPPGVYNAPGSPVA